MKRKATLVTFLFLTAAVSAFAQNADPAKTVAPAKMPTVKEVLDRYVTAVGGRQAIEKVKTRTAAGTLELIPMNLKGTFETYAAPDAKSYTKMNLVGIGELIESNDGKAAWSVNPMQGSRDKSGAEFAQTKLLNDFYRDVRLEKLYPKMELKGIEKVGDKDAYVIEATAEGVPAEKWYFDTKSGLLLRSDVTALSPEGPQAMKIYYEDMRAVDGIQMAFRVRTETPSFTIVLTSTEIKHGTPIDDAKFVKPKQ